MAPVDRGAERALARRGRSVSARQQLETVTEAGSDLLHRQHADPRGGELDGQRHAIQRAAECRDGRGIAFGDDESARCRSGTVGKEPDRLVARQLRRIAGTGRRYRQRWHLEDDLGCHAQRLAARHHHPEPWRAGQQPLAQVCGRVDQMLAVVQRHQQPARRERVGKCF